MPDSRLAQTPPVKMLNFEECEPALKDKLQDSKPLKIYSPKAKSLKNPILVIFDINGTLLQRIKYSKDLEFAKKADWQYDSFGIYTRPYAKEMLAEFGALGFKFGLWTTMNQSFAVNVGQRFAPLEMEFTIGGHFCTRVGNAKVKDLHTVYTDSRISRSEVWSDCNTILVDDTKEKGRMNAENMIVIPTFDTKKDALDWKLVILLEYFKTHWEKFENCTDVRVVLKEHPIDWTNNNCSAA